MTERRKLIEGLGAKTPEQLRQEREFVFQGKAPAAPAGTAPPARVPLTTRLRADLFAALKRESLQRQLGNIEPSTIQELLEEALEPWLVQKGYL